MKLIELSKGKAAKVDDIWFSYLNQWKWHFDGKYARRNVVVNGKLEHVYMHKVVADYWGKVDHKNLDQLDNRKENLRPCTTQTNTVNSRKAMNKSSSYKGVSKSGRQWRTQIWNGSERFDACFPEERWAAEAADLNAYTLYGGFVRLNFPDAILVVQE